MERAVNALIRLLPLVLVLILLGKVAGYPDSLPPAPPDSTIRPRTQAPYALQLLRDSRQTGILIAALVAPFPLALAATLRHSRRRGKVDASSLMGIHLGVILAIDLTAFVTLAGLGECSDGTFLAAQALAFLAGTLALDRSKGHALIDRDLHRDAKKQYGFVVLALVAAGLLSVHFGQAFDYDLLNHHYYNGYHFLKNRHRIDFAVGNLETYFNPILDAGLYCLIKAAPPIWVGFVLGALHGAAVVVLVMIALRVVGLIDGLGHLRAPLAIAIALAGACEPYFLMQLGTAFYDNLLAIFVLSSLYWIIPAVAGGLPEGSGGAGRPVLWAGLSLGLATGLKLTQAPYAVATLAALVLAGGTARGRLARAAWFVLGAGSGFLLADGYWMALLYGKFGNPFFPWYNALFKSPYWIDHNLSFVAIVMPKTWIGFLLMPFHMAWTGTLATEVASRDLRLAIVAVLLLLWPATRLAGRITGRSVASVRDPRPARVAGFLATFAVVTFLLWVARFHILRYLVALNLLVPLLSVVLLQAVLRTRPRMLAAAAATVLIATGAWIVVPQYGRVAWSDSFFNVRPPALRPDQRGIVLMTYVHGGETGSFSTMNFSHVVTAFPKRMRFIKIDSPQIDLRLMAVFQARKTRPLQMRADVEDVIRNHRGPFFLLTHSDGLWFASLLLSEYGLAVDDPAPLSVEATGYSLRLWKVHRVPGTEPAPRVAGAISPPPKR